MNDPFEHIVWPTPTIATVARIRDEITHEAKVYATIAKRSEVKRSWKDRVKYLETLLQTAARELIEIAEEWKLSPGKDRKEAVDAAILAITYFVEARTKHLFPPLVGGFAWRMIRRQLSKLTQRVFDDMDAKGEVNKR